MQLHPHQGYAEGDLNNVTVLTPAPVLGVIRMAPAAKALWVDALRSGHYPQIADSLRVDDGFCALGVLCDVFRIATGHGQWHRYPEGGSQAFAVDGYVDCGEPPSTVAHWAGLVDDAHMSWVDCNPMVDGAAVSVWNDQHRLPFSMIADKIEAYL